MKRISNSLKDRRAKALHGSIGAIKFTTNKQYIPSIIQIICLILYITIDNVERIIPDLYLLVL